jgi:hypothetical protein
MMNQSIILGTFREIGRSSPTSAMGSKKSLKLDKRDSFTSMGVFSNNESNN